MKALNRNNISTKIKKKSPATSGQKELLQLQKDWETAKKKVEKELSKEKNPQKKVELKLIADYFADNFFDAKNATVSSKI